MSKAREFWIDPGIVKVNPRGCIHSASTVMLAEFDIHVREVLPTDKTPEQEYERGFKDGHTCCTLKTSEQVIDAVCEFLRRFVDEFGQPIEGRHSSAEAIEANKDRILK